MMPTSLRDVFSQLGYQDNDQQIALTKLAEIRGCFDGQIKDSLISDEKAKELLTTQFAPSLKQGIERLCDMTQKQWLRASFKKEGVGNGKDPVINVERWIDNNPTFFSKSIEQQLLGMFKTLGLVDTVRFPEEKVAHVVVHGAMEDHASERINFIPDFSGRLYYMSNPRGLFNSEPSLAPLLASWFGRPEAVSVIQAVLDINKNIKSSDKHWLKNLDGLKSDILKALDEKTWPTGKGWYYRNPEPFELAAKAENRSSLAGWPTAVDMVEYLLQQKASREEGEFKNIEICPIYSVRSGRVANTEDNIADWYNLYGRQLPVNTTVVFVSNNSRSLHYIPFQDVILKKVLQTMAAAVDHNLKVITVGPGANEISLSAATDVFAKIFYSKRPAILESLKALTIPEQISGNSNSNIITNPNPKPSY